MSRKLTRAEHWMRRLERLAQEQPEGTIVFISSTGTVSLLEESSDVNCSANDMDRLASFNPPRPHSWQVDGR